MTASLRPLTMLTSWSTQIEMWAWQQIVFKIASYKLQAILPNSNSKKACRHQLSSVIYIRESFDFSMLLEWLYTSVEKYNLLGKHSCEMKLLSFFKVGHTLFIWDINFNIKRSPKCKKKIFLYLPTNLFWILTACGQVTIFRNRWYKQQRTPTGTG